ncbi:EamA family transporter RarD [Pontibacterium granulatum]|uniref:EamA family transporter RarD n=1 Tax=Pontibacterium granulatum TaxID=2036029 RepID=UPI00249B3D49|nr:EamA family transporter RarD [Pontibacterium granulatum]MDI3326688.1 EamA family transporter RarD [Pontibacterium granulatum]
MPTNTAQQGLLYALIAYGLWGFFPLFFKQVTDLPALEVLAHRVIWACVFTGLVLTLMRSWKTTVTHLKNARIWAALGFSALLIAVNWGVFIYAVGEGQVLASSLGYFLTPLVNVLLGTLVLGEKQDKFRKFALVLATAGVLWQIIALGELPWISLILASSFGVYGLVRKQAPVDTLSGLLIETLVLCPIAFAYWYWLLDTGQDHFLESGFDAGRLIAMGVLTSVPLLAFAAAAQRLSLTVVGFLTYMAPTCHFLLAVFLYNEPFGTHQLISFSLIWAALFVFSGGALLNKGNKAQKKAV